MQFDRKDEYNFVILRGGDKIEVYEKLPATNQWDVVIENVTIEIDKTNVLKLSGKKRCWDFFFGKQWVEDMERKPIEKHWEMGYKTFYDFFRRKKKPYVIYWFRYEDLESVDFETNTWTLVH